MKTPSQEEIEYQSTLLCKARIIDVVDGMSKESMYKAGFDDGIEFLKSQPKDINVPQSVEVMTLEECKERFAKDHNVKDWKAAVYECTYEIGLGRKFDLEFIIDNVNEIYTQQFKAKADHLQSELEQVKADNVKLKELISSMCSLWRKSHGSSSMHSIILEAEKVLQSTKQ